MKRSRLLVTVVFIGAAVLTLSVLGCSTLPRYTLHLLPSPEAEKGPTTGLTIGLLPFEDARPQPQFLGTLIDGEDKSDIVLDSPSPANDVTYILRRTLRGRGIPTVDLESWIPDPEHLKDLPEDVDVVFAGRIEALEVTATSALVNAKVQYRVRLSAKVGFKKEGVVLAQTSNVTAEEILLRFNPQRVEETLNTTLADALNRLLDAVFTAGPKSG
ncbi:MAG TPA: hypothetical protein VEI04_00230 [Syntrophobacteria bacterium]|nr:hypothetical protein [Syntrophobacteria bacterium]